jgi:hypothetical protein
MGRGNPGDDDCRCGGGGGVAGARGTTLGDAATDAKGAAGAEGGLRCGTGGGTGLRTPGATVPGVMPRDDGGGGMRDGDSGVVPPTGRGGMLTGLGTTLMGADGIAGDAVSEAAWALGSFSSPIQSLASRGASSPRRAPRV